jgi:hypothetical protein
MIRGSFLSNYFKSVVIASSSARFLLKILMMISFKPVANTSLGKSDELTLNRLVHSPVSKPPIARYHLFWAFQLSSDAMTHPEISKI